MTPIIQTIQISEYDLSPKQIVAGTRGSFGLTKLDFSLSPEWDEATCVVTFHPRRGKPVSVPWVGLPIDIPPEIMKYSGVSGYVFSGTVYSEGEPTGKCVSLPGEIDVMFTLDDEGGNSKGFTPELYAQILALIGNLGDLSTEAKDNLVAAINEAAASGGGSAGFKIGAGLALDEATNTLSAEISAGSFAEISNTKVQEIFNKVMQEA